VKEIVCQYGAPSKLLSDRSCNFIGDIFTRVYERLEVSKLKTSSFYPQTNSYTECFKILGSILKMFTKENQKNWDQIISYTLYAYNTSTHLTTQ
jgi:hypothetical protein